MDLHIPVKEVFVSSGLMDELDQKYVIDYRGKAIEALFKDIDHNYCKNTCPYELYLECKSVK